MPPKLYRLSPRAPNQTVGQRPLFLPARRPLSAPQRARRTSQAHGWLPNRIASEPPSPAFRGSAPCKTSRVCGSPHSGMTYPHTYRQGLSCRKILPIPPLRQYLTQVDSRSLASCERLVIWRIRKRNGVLSHRMAGIAAKLFCAVPRPGSSLPLTREMVSWNVAERRSLRRNFEGLSILMEDLRCRLLHWAFCSAFRP